MKATTFDLQQEQLDQAYKLIDVIDLFINQFAGSPVSSIQSLVEVTRRLKVFASQQLSFFNNPALQTAKDFPLNYIYALIHDQVACDFTVLREAVFQRLASDSRSLQTLNIADHLAEATIHPILGYQAPKYVQSWGKQQGAKQDNSALKTRPTLVAAAGSTPVYPEDTIVITYFRKFPSIRLIPYAPVALVGIPFTSIFRPQDLLATPHELGHQVFWRWRALRSVIQTKSDTLPAYAGRWAEEIFADTFGVQAMGPAAALFAQELEASFDSLVFKHDDGEHPVSLLRPYVHAKALGSPKARVTQELVRDWTNYRQSRTDADQNFKNSSNKTITVDSSVGKQGVDEYGEIVPDSPVDELVGLCLAQLQAIPQKSAPWWQDELNGSIDSLFANFSSYLQSLPNEQAIEPLRSDPQIAKRCSLDSRRIHFEDETWFKVVTDYLKYDPTTLAGQGANTIEPKDWLPLMDMDAWADKGPTSNPRGG